MFWETSHPQINQEINKESLQIWKTCIKLGLSKDLTMMYTWISHSYFEDINLIIERSEELINKVHRNIENNPKSYVNNQRKYPKHWIVRLDLMIFDCAIDRSLIQVASIVRNRKQEMHEDEAWVMEVIKRSILKWEIQHKEHRNTYDKLRVAWEDTYYSRCIWESDEEEKRKANFSKILTEINNLSKIVEYEQSDEEIAWEDKPYSC